MECLPKHPLVFSLTSVVLIVIHLVFQNSLSAQDSITHHEVIVGNIELSGNKKTSPGIIFRELQFACGDRFLRSDFAKSINQSRLNLLNTSLFNFVTIDTVEVPDSLLTGVMNVKISVLERWYVWPIPILQITDRNFNAWLKSKDFSRINYGIDLKWYNFSGRMDEFDLILQGGKNRQVSVAYQNPYIDKKKRLGIGFDAGYKNNREVGYLSQDDKLSFAFISSGLSVEKYVSVNALWRNNFFTTHLVVLGFHARSFSDSLLMLNPDYSYPEIAEPTYFNLYYKLKIDHRDIKYYPLKGWYMDIEVNKAGFGFAFEKPVNIAWAKTTNRIYFTMANRWYSGMSFIGKISSANWQPYFQIQGLGYNREYIRGYEYNVVDGKHFGIIRTNVKYALIPESEHTIGLIPTPKFGRIHLALYLTAFADAGYVWQPQWESMYNNVLPNTFLAGTGLGIDFVTYYDKVVRIEYAVNKSGKSGIFIHFIAGI